MDEELPSWADTGNEAFRGPLKMGWSAARRDDEADMKGVEEDILDQPLDPTLHPTTVPRAPDDRKRGPPLDTTTRKVQKLEPEPEPVVMAAPVAVAPPSLLDFVQLDKFITSAVKNTITSDEEFIKYYSVCSYDTRKGLKGSNMLKVLFDKMKIKLPHFPGVIGRSDFSDISKTSQECEKAQMIVDGRKLSYETNTRKKPYYRDETGLKGGLVKCYICNEDIESGAGTNKLAEGYHCEHFLIIGDIANIFRLSIEEYRIILKKMLINAPELYEAAQSFSQRWWKEVYKPSHPPCNLLKAEYIFVDIDHSTLKATPNIHNIIRVLVTLIYGYTKQPKPISYSVTWRNKFLPNLKITEKQWLYEQIQRLIGISEKFSADWEHERTTDPKKFKQMSNLSVLTTIRYLDDKKKKQLDKAFPKKGKPSKGIKIATDALASFINLAPGLAKGKQYFKNKSSICLSVLGKLSQAIETELGFRLGQRGGAVGDSLEPPTGEEVMVLRDFYDKYMMELPKRESEAAKSLLELHAGEIESDVIYMALMLVNMSQDHRLEEYYSEWLLADYNKVKERPDWKEFCDSVNRLMREGYTITAENLIDMSVHREILNNLNSFVAAELKYYENTDLDVIELTNILSNSEDFYLLESCNKYMAARAVGRTRKKSKKRKKPKAPPKRKRPRTKPRKKKRKRTKKKKDLIDEIIARLGYKI